jgi:hypothetical protein
MNPRAALLAALATRWLLSACVSTPKCPTDLSPVGYDLILTAVPGARVQLMINGEQKEIVMKDATERVASSSDTAEVRSCRMST